MKKTKLLFVMSALIFLSIGKLVAQKEVTYYYNENNIGVATLAECETYKVFSIDEQGNPIGKIMKYYKTGELIATSESAKVIDRFNDANSVFCGEIKVYYKSGKLQEKCYRNEQGQLIGDDIAYFESGIIKMEAKFHYQDETIDGKATFYSENGTKISEVEYRNGKPKNEWYLVFDENGKSYKYNVKTNEPYVENMQSEIVTYNLTLTSGGNLRNKGDTLGDIISYVPSGTTVGVYSKDKGYYKVNFNGKIGYLSELYFDINMNSAIKKQNTITEKNTEKQEVKSYYKDDKAYQYYVHNGISVTMHLSIEKNYGKYYVAYISIENLTGNSFNFNPNDITAIYTKNGENYTGEVLSSNEYMSKVSNRQAWNAALVAFGESYSASQAGYSSSSTTSNTSSYSNSYGSASGYYGNTYGSVYGSSSTYGSSTTKSSTQKYDGAANYAAQQNAQKNISNYQNQQYQIKNVLNQGYLKLNTLNNEERMVGYVNIKYKSADKVKITIPVNGVNYEFWWNNK